MGPKLLAQAVVSAFWAQQPTCTALAAWFPHGQTSKQEFRRLPVDAEQLRLSTIGRRTHFSG
jgi:hypothetical protein